MSKIATLNMVELIITEKPSSARKVAEALAEQNPIQKKHKQCSYFELSHNGKSILVTSAVGHLFGLAEKNKGGWTYPVFEIVWEPTYLAKELKYGKDYADTIAMLAKKAQEFTIACDYDVEGEVIGWNVIRFLCKQKDAQRMKFSTLTKPDLLEAYEGKADHLDWGQAIAGETRHKLDWFYGINLSRALTASVKAAGSFKILSIGRVQGPALKILADREKEIAAFTPQPYWQIVLKGRHGNSDVEAIHQHENIFDAKEAERIMSVVQGKKEALVTTVTRTQREQPPPAPFDLTTLQSEAYNLFRITPKQTLEIAQNLYLMGLTSYPRTSSQQLTPKIGFTKILRALARQSPYSELCNSLLHLPSLSPHNGKKTDPAHPAIFPTGTSQQGLKEREFKIYDLIVRRFMATFAQAALRETMEVLLDVKKEIFVARGTRTIEENWHRYYKPYVKLEEITLPDMKERDTVAVKKIEKLSKETQPPKRYNQSSIIKELEKHNLGTKATRADILDRLFQRGYLEGVQITVTKLGLETIQLLEKYAPTITDEKLTAHFEEEMDKIREGEEKQEKVLQEAKTDLTSLLTAFKKKEKIIGHEILQSLQETWDEQNYIGSCPQCKEGKLMMKRGKFGRFIACDKYPQCTTTFNVPDAGTIRRTDKRCEQCQHPLITIVQQRRKQEVCINQNCKSKTTVEERKEIRHLEQQKVEKPCPQCGKDLVVRRSVYGTFVGCSGYPKCKHTEKLESSNGK